jgi:hypothetical protein
MLEPRTAGNVVTPFVDIVGKFKNDGISVLPCGRPAHSERENRIRQRYLVGVRFPDKLEVGSPFLWKIQIV